MTCELILGGARSGKSREAERRAAGSGLAASSALAGAGLRLLLDIAAREQSELRIARARRP